MSADLQERRAAKPYRCQFCGGSIEKGETYGFYQGTPWSHWENDSFFSWRGHLDPCWKAWDEISTDYDGYLPDGPDTWRTDYLDGGYLEDATPVIQAAWEKVNAELKSRVS